MEPREVFRAELRGDLGSCVYKKNGVHATFVITAKSAGMLAGMEFVPLILGLCEQEFFLPVHHQLVRPVDMHFWVLDGDRLEAGKCVARFDGDSEVLRNAERTILNTLQRLSGIATHTATQVARVAHTGVRLLDTRKNSSIYRMIDKEALKIGGAHPHRAGMYDGEMIKDNDITLYGLTNAIERRLQVIRFQTKLEIEVGSHDLLQAVLADGRADIIMLDNMSPAEMRAAVRCIRFESKSYVIEASGIGDYDLVEVAETGVDAISLSSLITKGAGNPPDISMKAVN